MAPEFVKTRPVEPFGQEFEFARALGLQMVERGDGHCQMAIDIVPQQHFSPQGAAHGGVAYSLADTAMGGALTGAFVGRLLEHHDVRLVMAAGCCR